MRRFILTAALIAPLPLATQAKVPTPAQQIALAVQAIPADMRADATVLGYNAAGKLGMLRQGKGAMMCVADEPSDTTFGVTCYQKSFDPWVARGRELRAQGVKDVDTVRFREVKSGKIVMPKQAALYSLTGPMSAVNVTTGKIGPAVLPEYNLYIPFATPEMLGITDKLVPGIPYMMFPGTPKAHVMLMVMPTGH